MGTRNRAFNSEVGDVDDIPNISGTNQDRHDGTQLSKFADKFAGIDLNGFATRKTVAQGMLDLALLTANAAQLKRVMYTGPEHRFYTLLMTLIIISISLQMVQAIIMCLLAIVFDLNKTDDHRRGNIANNILLMVTIVSVVINIIISAFDFADYK
ncbi:unnamed protein product [Diamesa tonsa]